MKILQINRINAQSYTNFRNNPIRFNQQEDTFVRTNEIKSPSFKGGIQQKLCKEILGNPEALKKYMAAMGAGLSAAFVALFTGASDNETPKTKEEQFDKNTFQNIMDSMNPFIQTEANKQQDSQIDEYKSKIEQLEREKEELKSQLAQYYEKNENTKTDEAEQEQEQKKEQDVKQEEQNSIQEMNYISFPKKRGRLSAAQEKLKQVVESTQFSEDVSPKVILICEELLKKGSHGINGESVDNNAIVAEFADEIFSNRENQDNLKLVVDDYYVKCGLNPKEESEIDNELDGILGLPKPNVKVVGKIDLSTIPTRKKKSEAQGQGEEISETPKRPRISAGNPNEDFNETTEITKSTDANKKTVIYKFRMPGTLVKEHICQNITRLLLSFEQKSSVDSETGKEIYRRWMSRNPFSKAINEDIKNEYTHQNNNPDNADNSRYVNINSDNVEMIADLINSDERYQKLFTLHSAMRFIDRFIDFNSDVSIEEQSKENLDCLIETIHDAFKKGVDIKEYKDAKKTIGAEIVISPDYYSERASKVFGSFPLDITFCEKQNSKYYSKYNKQGIISTIYPLGA